MRNISVLSDVHVPGPGCPVQSFCVNAETGETYFVTIENEVLCLDNADFWVRMVHDLLP